MCALLDPAKVNDLAFADQTELIERLGGVDTILRSEAFDHTPVQ